VADQLSGTCSGLYVDAKADRQEGLELFRELVWLLETRSAIGRNEIQSLERLLIQVRWFRLDHLNGHDTQRPDIDLVAVLFLLDDFRGHPVWSSDHSRTLAALLGKLRTETEVGCQRLASYR